MEKRIGVIIMQIGSRHRRSYQRTNNRLKAYRNAEHNGDVIDTEWLVKNHYSKNPEAARKMLNRDCRDGILVSFRSYQYTFYQLAKNVTYYTGATSPKSQALQAQQDSILHMKMSTNKPVFRQSPQKKEHSLQVGQDRPRSNMAQKQVTLTIPPSPAYMASFPDCRCIGAFICDSCRGLPTVFTPAFDRLQSSHSTTVTALKAPAPVRASELLPVKKPLAPRWARYGLLGRRWQDKASVAYDAIDRLIPTNNLPPVHRLFFEGHDERAAYSGEFETQYIRNKLIDEDMMVSFDGLSIPVHIERYKKGKVILKADLDENPIHPDRVPDFKRAIQKALSIDIGPAETWKTTATDMGYDLPTVERCRRSMEEQYKGHTIHAYNKKIQGQRYLRVEVQLNPATTSHAEYTSVLQRANSVLLEACGKN